MRMEFSCNSTNTSKTYTDCRSIYQTSQESNQHTFHKRGVFFINIHCCWFVQLINSVLCQTFKKYSQYWNDIFSKVTKSTLQSWWITYSMQIIVWGDCKSRFAYPVSLRLLWHCGSKQLVHNISTSCGEIRQETQRDKETTQVNYLDLKQPLIKLQ